MDFALRVLGVLLMLLMPIILGIFLRRKYGVSWRLFVYGILTFVGSQVLHIPFNQFILLPALDSPGFSIDREGLILLAGALALGLSAGVFEESARYIVYRTRLKESRTWEEGLMYGAGHGGIEAILLGVLSINAIILLLAIENGSFDVSTLSEAAQTQIGQLITLPTYQLLFPALERAFAITLHLSLSIIVLQVFVRGSLLWLFLAIGWHAFANLLGVFGLATWGPAAAEALIGVVALISLGILFALRPEERPEFHPAPKETE